MFRRKTALRAVGVVSVLAIGIVLTLPMGVNAAGKRIAIWHVGDLGADQHTMRDTSPSVPSNDGTSTDIRVVPGWDGYAYRFNGTSARVVVPDHATLNPGRQPDLDHRPCQVPCTAADRRLYPDLQGGRKDPFLSGLDQFPGQGSVFLPRFAAHRIRPRRFDLADRTWHTIVCSKVGRSISVTVDGVRTPSRVRVGAIANAPPLVRRSRGQRGKQVPRSHGRGQHPGRLVDRSPTWVADPSQGSGSPHPAHGFLSSRRHRDAFSISHTWRLFLWGEFRLSVHAPDFGGRTSSLPRLSRISGRRALGSGRGC